MFLKFVCLIKVPNIGEGKQKFTPTWQFFNVVHQTDMVVGLCFMSKLFKNFFSSKPGPTLLFLIMDSTKFPILGSI